MTCEQRIRAIRLIEQVEKYPEMAQELGIEIRQEITAEDGGTREGMNNHEEKKREAS